MTCSGLIPPVPHTTSWRAEINGKRFSGMIEIEGSFWAIWLKAQSATAVLGSRRIESRRNSGVIRYA
jgi:SRSO17 transposase